MGFALNYTSQDHKLSFSLIRTQQFNCVCGVKTTVCDSAKYRVRFYINGFKLRCHEIKLKFSEVWSNK